jgi:hypothetical protein
MMHRANVMRSPNLVQRAGTAMLRSIAHPLWSATHRLTGKRIQTTLHIDDMAMVAGVFAADAAAAQRRMPSADLRVVEFEPGRTEIQIVALDYRRVRPLRPYREVAMVVPVELRLHDGVPERGTAVLHLPVTSEEARSAGVVSFGQPKIVADVDLLARPGEVEATLSAHGVHVLTLEVDELPVMRQRNHRVAFTLRDDHRLVASDFDAEGEIGISAEPGGARLVLGPHAIAAGLRELGIELESRAHLYAPRLEGRISRPRVVGETAPEPVH